MKSTMLFTTMYHEQKNATMFMFKLNNLPTVLGVYTGVSALEGNIKGLTYVIQDAMKRIGSNDLEIHCDTSDVMKYASGKYKPFSQVARNFVNYLNKQRQQREIEVIDDLTAEQASVLKREAKQNKENAVYPERQQREVKARAFEHSYIPASTATTDHFAANLEEATIDCPFIDDNDKKWCMVEGVDVPVSVTNEKGFSATLEEATMERPYVDKDGRKFCTMKGINMPVEIIDDEPNEEVFPFKVTVFETDGTIRCAFNQDDFGARSELSSQPAKKAFSLSGKKTTEASSTPPVRSGGFSLAGKKVSQPSGAMPVPASALTKPAPTVPEKTAKQIKQEQEEEERRRQEEENSKYQQMSFADFGFSGFY